MLQALSSFLSLSWEERDQRASVLSLAVTVVLGVPGLVLSVVSTRQKHRSHVGPALPDEALAAGARLRPTALPRMRTLSAGRARVHMALPLPTGHDRPQHRWRTPWWATGVVLDPDLPLFVPRDLSDEVTAWMRRAREQGGFLLLVGTSSVGKTRLLFETARRELSAFRVLVPDLGDGGAVNALAETVPPGPVVVWLDELQRFLPGPYFVSADTAQHEPVTAGALRRLLDSDTPVVVLATLWPDYLDQLRATDTVDNVTRPRHPGSTDVLALQPTQLRVNTFTETEKRRARELGVQDPRLAMTAASNAEFNVTETLAGAPRIVQRYDEASASRLAVVHAAVDARRLGIQGPLTEDLLREAARGYLTDIHPDDAWFDEALHDLRRNDRREDAATAPLLIVPTADRRGVLGYTVTDYLLQVLLRQRRSQLLTETTWQALIHHVSHPDDRWRLADGAFRRLQYRQAEHLYSPLVVEDNLAARRLVNLLAMQGRENELRVRANGGDSVAAIGLANLLAKRGELEHACDVLRPHADGDRQAAAWLNRWLEQLGATRELRDRAEAGDRSAATNLVDLLGGQGRLAEARAIARFSDHQAGVRLADRLIQSGQLHQALDVLRFHACNGHRETVEHLTKLLIEHGEIDEAMTVLRTHAQDPRLSTQLNRLLAAQGRLEELRARAANGNGEAATWLATRLLGKTETDDDKVDEALELLRPHADAGHQPATRLLNKLLEQDGREQDLRTRANHDHDAAVRLATRLRRQGEIDEALSVLRAHADAGHVPAASVLADLLVRQGRIDELRHRTKHGDLTAAEALIDHLESEGQNEQALEALRIHAHRDHDELWLKFISILLREGRLDELRAHAEADDDVAADVLVGHLESNGDERALWYELHAGIHQAADTLVELLHRQGRSEEAEKLTRWGVTPDGTPSDPY
ncbi:tetratricopeptide repeat protein [Saccharothrix obliqua]|uniref:tetratricopeptide repeat protein n=1 Tax=Saccharothrix obliqua TaxID=2861747 RepID=UPI001C5EC783|nr:hypothetical protein [Saccharothrix obliqua]MBW4717321.1 hypothetical protein [Saccharothrix obliqua]